MKTLLIALLLILPLCAADLLGPDGKPLVIPKTPFEQFNCSADFAPTTAVTDTLTVSSVTSVNSQGGADSSADIIAPSPVPAILPGTKKVVFAVRGGTSGQTHVVSIKIIDTTSGEQFDGKIKITVKD